MAYVCKVRSYGRGKRVFLVLVCCCFFRVSVLQRRQLGDSWMGVFHKNGEPELPNHEEVGKAQWPSFCVHCRCEEIDVRDGGPRKAAKRVLWQMNTSTLQARFCLPNKHDSLQLLNVLVILFVAPFLLTYAPSRVALDAFAKNRRGYDYSDHDATNNDPGRDFLPKLVLASINTNDATNDQQQQHYILAPTIRQDAQQSTFQAVSAIIGSSSLPPDAATALQRWSEMMSLSSLFPVQLEESINQTEWCLSVASSTTVTPTKKVCKPSSSLEGTYVKPNGNTFARVSVLVHRPYQQPQQRAVVTAAEESTRTTTTASAVGFRQNPNKRRSPSLVERLHPILTQTGFGILAALQVYLFVVYWNGNVSTSAVGKIYTNMWHGGELWRALSGSTAHFDLWHIGLNMSAFYQLSQVLQSDFSPVVYLGLNLSFMALVSAIWMLWQYARHRRTSPEALASVPTVGYSGVLFALATMVTLKQPQSCPIPFVDSVCFSTYDVGPIRWSFAPLVQLAIVQVVLPRVSFAGHLSGIVVGFLYAWGVLPPTTMYPSVVWPVLHLIYRMLVAPHVGAGDGRLLGDARSPVQKVLTVPGIRLALLVCILSGFSLGWTDPLVWSYLATMAFWIQGSLAPAEQALAWKRGFCVYAIVLLVTMAVTMGAWMLLPTVWVTLRGCLSVVAQAATLWVGLWRILEEVCPADGIFHYTVCWTLLQPLSRLKSSWQQGREAGSVGSPFSGEGRRLRETQLV